jgi:hypothetical protein
VAKTNSCIIRRGATENKDSYAVLCLRCGRSQRFSSISIPGWVSAVKEFRRKHAKCKPEAEKCGTQKTNR